MPDQQRIAYFCMEYGLDDRLPLYAGGLGILAGDTLRAARDLGMSLVGIGIRWSEGYGQQRIDAGGMPTTEFATRPPDEGLEDTGVRVHVSVSGRPVNLRVWRTTAFGNAPLYLLDADLPENPPGLTARLYGGTPDDRVAQEIVLGVGGVRALRALGLETDVYHFNEGHALLAAFELIRENLGAGMAYDDAVAATRAQVVFTTHTPVIEGNESHPIERLRRMGAAEGFTDEQLELMGGSPFNMTVGALRLARKANAVARLHAETANRMWAHVPDRAPIVAITNGIHEPTWVDADVAAAADAGDIWAAHAACKRALATFVAERTGRSLDPEALLVGFARRAVAYKRALLLFSDEARVAPLLESGRLQVVFSGRAHPQDAAGQQMVADLVAAAGRYPRGVFFVEDYGMAVGRAMTRGADVWLNTPRRPMEASGTSGMKAAMNGVLNASILDGWWPEACDDGVNGWQIGGANEASDAAAQDAHDAADLYRVLLEEIVPAYYDDRPRWIAMMRASVASTRGAFGAERMLREYASELYAA